MRPTGVLAMGDKPSSHSLTAFSFFRLLPPSVAGTTVFSGALVLSFGAGVGGLHARRQGPGHQLHPLRGAAQRAAAQRQRGVESGRRGRQRSGSGSGSGCWSTCRAVPCRAVATRCMGVRTRAHVHPTRLDSSRAPLARGSRASQAVRPCAKCRTLVWLDCAVTNLAFALSFLFARLADFFLLCASLLQDYVSMLSS